MKRTLIMLLIVCQSVLASAQKSVVYADVGVSLAQLYPGASVTFNYNVFTHLGAGVGFQAYQFHATMPKFQYVPATYAELRLNISPRKKNQFFVFLDVGIDLYQHSNDEWEQDYKVYKVHSNNGVYTGFGLAYLHKRPKRRWNPYVSLKLISNSYKVDYQDLYSNKTGTSNFGDATLAVSVGCKF